MLTTGQLAQLERFDGRGARVLSVYLNLQPERQLRRAYQIAFKALVNGAKVSGAPAGRARAKGAAG